MRLSDKRGSLPPRGPLALLRAEPLQAFEPPAPGSRTSSSASLSSLLRLGGPSASPAEQRVRDRIGRSNQAGIDGVRSALNAAGGHRNQADRLLLTEPDHAQTLFINGLTNRKKLGRQDFALGPGSAAETAFDALRETRRQRKQAHSQALRNEAVERYMGIKATPLQAPEYEIKDYSPTPNLGPGPRTTPGGVSIADNLRRALRRAAGYGGPASSVSDVGSRAG